MKNHIGTIIGIIGVVLSIYFYELSKAERIPVFKTALNPTLIANTQNIEKSKIRVIDINDNPIDGQVWSLEFIFCNLGKIPLKKTEILEAIKINLSEDNSKIIDYRINIQSRRDIVKANLSQANGDITLDYQILEKDDYIRGQIIFNGSSQTKLVLSGTLEGVKEIYDSEPIDWNLLILEFGKNLIIGFIAFGLFSLVVYILGVSLSKLILIFPEKILNANSKNKISKSLSFKNSDNNKLVPGDYIGAIALAIAVFYIAFSLAYNSMQPYYLKDEFVLEFPIK